MKRAFTGEAKILGRWFAKTAIRYYIPSLRRNRVTYLTSGFKPDGLTDNTHYLLAAYRLHAHLRSFKPTFAIVICPPVFTMNDKCFYRS
jgi:hypothetical protein